MTVIRVAPHVHSDWSHDGAHALDEIAERFARRGCRVVLMCEHSPDFTDERWQDYVDACARASRPDVLLVPGIEYGDADDIVHVPTWGPLPFLGPAPEIGSLLREVSAAGGAAVFAHPSRRDAWRRFQPGWSPYLVGVEVWSRKYDGWAPRRANLDLARREGLAPMVALDFHTRRQSHPLSVELALTGPPTLARVHEALAARRIEPRAYGRPLGRFTSGPALRAAEASDHVRRGLAAGARTARRIGGHRT